MDNSNSKQVDKNLLPNFPSTKDLRGRQSVRATFRLSEACIEAISILSTQLGIKQKSVFDYLMEDSQALSDIAREIRSAETEDPKGRVQKTFVISRRSLAYLDMISNQHKAPRDALVENSVRRLFPIVRIERLKHEKRKQLLVEIRDHFIKFENILSKAREMVGQNDPVVDKLRTAVTAYENTIDDISSFIEKGKSIEKFQNG